MLPIFILFFLLIVLLSTLTTVPFSIAILVISTVIFRKPWVFFAAFILGLFLDLSLLAPLGQTSLLFAVFIFTLFLYERKFETQTLTFVFFTTFLGSLTYLKVFGYNDILLQSFVSAVFAVLLFKFLWLKLGPRSETI